MFNFTIYSLLKQKRLVTPTLRAVVLKHWDTAFPADPKFGWGVRIYVVCDDPRKDTSTLYIGEFYSMTDDTLWGSRMTKEIREQLDFDRLECLIDAYQHPFVPAMHDAVWRSCP